MDRTWIDDGGAYLRDGCPLPLDRPFTRAQAEGWGVPRQVLRSLVGHGLVRPMLRGVYVASQAPDSLHLRTRGLALVLPPEAVVTDRTAAWLHGVDVLRRGAHLEVPPLHAFYQADTRMKRSGVDSGRRRLLPGDITEVYGVRTTTALRTTLDLGRLLWRYDAIAAIDGFLRQGLPHDLLSAEVTRFRGYRGVIQLRELVPLGDPRAESGPESALRLNCHEAGLRDVQPQVWVRDDTGARRYRIDLAIEELRYGMEYDGEQHHTSDADVEHDERRRSWCADTRGWHFEVFTKTDLYDRRPDPLTRLRAGLVTARRRCLWTPGWPG